MRHGLALGQFGLVFGYQRGVGLERPALQHRDVFVLKTAPLVHAEVAVLRHAQQRLEHVRTRFGAREQGMVAQQLSRHAQVTAAGELQVQADQVDHALFGFFQLRAQVFGAEVARNLHHAFGGFGAHGGQLVGVQQPVLHAVGQRFGKEGAGVENGNAAGACRRWRSQMADSSSASSAAGVALPRSVSLVSKRSSSSSASNSSPVPRSKARALARSTSSISINRSGNW